MKPYAIIFILILIFGVVDYSTAFAQIPWTKDDNNPVMSGSEGWAAHIFMPNVLHNTDSSRYEMWFGASLGPPDWRPYKIGFATSSDGIAWSMHPDPVLEPDSGAWDESTVERPMVLRENGQYKMWYTGWSPSNYLGNIGYATSPDGINWIKHGPITMDVHSGYYRFCCVLSVEGGGYEMWFDNGSQRIYYAASEDGIIWEKGNNNKPVLTTGTGGQWDSQYIFEPHVVLIDDVYHLWYTGIKDLDTKREIGYATSLDGINWNKYNDPATDETLYEDSDPVLQPGRKFWDYRLIEAGDVMVEGNTLRMWYAGRSSWPWQIGHATAPLNSSSGIDEFIDTALPQTFILNQNYPNPFNPTTVICYALPVTSHVDLSIYSLSGHKIATLVSEKQPAGTFNVSWDASGLASGVYLYRLQAGNYSETRKLILLR